MMIVWLAVGIIGVSLAFLLPSQALDPWVPLNAAGVASLAYLAAVMAAATRNPFPIRSKFYAWAGFLVIGTALALSWTGLDAQAHFQADQLTAFRKRIARASINDQLSVPLLKTLEAYHRQKTPKKKTIEAVFLELHPGARIGTNLYHSSYTNDSLMILVAALNDNAITLVGQEANVHGNKLDFQNWDGRKGMIQYRAQLTMKGVDYEPQN